MNARVIFTPVLLSSGSCPDVRPTEYFFEVDKVYINDCQKIANTTKGNLEKGEKKTYKFLYLGCSSSADTDTQTILASDAVRSSLFLCPVSTISAAGTQPQFRGGNLEQAPCSQVALPSK